MNHALRGNIDGLADRLIRVLELPEPSWQRMSEAAYKTAKSFTWEDATILFERALEAASDTIEVLELPGGRMQISVENSQKCQY